MVEELAKQPLPNPQEKLERLLLWIGDSQTAEHNLAEECSLTISAQVGLMISDNVDAMSFGWLLQGAAQEGLFEHADRGETRAFRLTMKGWKAYGDLKRQRSESRKGFMAMKFGDPVLEPMFEKALKPGALRAGFDLYKLTENQPAGLIDAQLRAALLGARFVVADLTHRNDGAYWEAGFGEGRGIPVIYACERSAWDERKTHFDTNHMVTIIWDAKQPKKAEDDLASLLRNTFRDDAKLED
ncbi:MAG: hypothetical protein NW223_18475 [Hyphomicrobiaceae bacterium]|nr:hypothetical protein [Hyphomicrobiaceae bacterium]